MTQDQLFWLVRHGQSHTNAGLPTSQPRGVPLTDLGRAQAICLASAVPTRPDRLIVSPYIRTTQTATPSLERFPDLTPEEWPIQEFTYLAPHEYEGTTLAQRMPLVTAYWERCDPDHRDGDGAETFREFIARVDAALDRLPDLPGFTLIFTHGHFMRGVIWRVISGRLPIDRSSMRRFAHIRLGLSVPNTAVLPLTLHENVPCLTGLRLNHITDDLRTT